MAKSSSPFATTDLSGRGGTSSYLAFPWAQGSGLPAGGSPGATTNTGVDPLNLQASVAQLLGLQGDAAAYEAAAKGSLLTAEGADIEAAAYGTAAGIANENQRAEAISEEIRQIQIMREVDQTIGGISASIAANGFTQSGSAIDIMQSSLRQGYLSTQLSGMQSAQTQRGYLEQAAAATGEMKSAEVRADAARLLAEQQSKTAATATANAGAVTNALTQLISGDENAEALLTALQTGDTAGALEASLTYNPVGKDEPLATVTGKVPTVETAGISATSPNSFITSIWG